MKKMCLDVVTPVPHLVLIFIEFFNVYFVLIFADFLYKFCQICGTLSTV
jgi:hypothetical protein